MGEANKNEGMADVEGIKSDLMGALAFGFNNGKEFSMDDMNNLANNPEGIQRIIDALTALKEAAE